MDQPRLQQVAAPPDLIEADAVASFFFCDERPLSGAAALLDWRMNGLLTRMITSHRINGVLGDQLWIQGNGRLSAPWLLFVGGGSRAQLSNPERGLKLMSHLLNVVSKSGVGRVALGLDPVTGTNSEAVSAMLGRAWGELGTTKPHCLFTFDQSWILDGTVA